MSRVIEELYLFQGGCGCAAEWATATTSELKSELGVVLDGDVLDRLV